MTRSGFRITGRVQGVGFRSWVQRTARALGLVGWVRNLPDGSVELLAQGTDNGMDALREALWQGPMFASVRNVEELAHGPVPPGADDGADESAAPDGDSAIPHDFHIRF